MAGVPAGADPRTIVRNLPSELNKCKRMFDGLARVHESYLVKVVPGRTGTAKPVLYWPRVSDLVEIPQETKGKA